MEDLFNLNPESFIRKQGGSRTVDEDLYNPGPDQGQNGVYKSIIRFVPWAVNPDLSKYKKYSAKLKNPLTNEKMWIDCPSTNGSPSVLWTLDTEIKKLEKEEPEIFNELTKNFGRFYNYYSCVYIKRDPQVEKLQGQIKVYSFGLGIDNLIQQEINPESDLVTVKKINPYSLLEGKDLLLVVKRKTKNWRDYSGSKFLTDVTPLIITYNEKDYPVSTDPKMMKFATEFLKKNSPDLSKYFFKPWTDEDYEKVATFVKAIVVYKPIMDNVINNLRDEKMLAILKKMQNHPAKTAAPTDSIEFTPAPAQPATAPAASIEVADEIVPQTKSQSVSIDLEAEAGISTAPSAPAAPATGGKKDELDVILAGM